jgi:hypothetical protein
MEGGNFITVIINVRVYISGGRLTAWRPSVVRLSSSHAIYYFVAHVLGCRDLSGSRRIIFRRGKTTNDRGFPHWRVVRVPGVGFEGEILLFFG